MTHPTQSNRAQFLALADALIDKGAGTSVWAGKTLTQWRAIVSDESIEYLAQVFAIQCIKGITAAVCREVIGAASDDFAISFDVMEHCEQAA